MTPQCQALRTAIFRGDYLEGGNCGREGRVSIIRRALSIASVAFL